MNKQQIENIIASVKPQTLIAVTKMQTIEDVQFLVDMGIENLAENKLQELLKKKEHFPNVNWHFIGRIQSNKINKIVANSFLIHSVASLRHLQLINDVARKQGKIQNILIQLNIANESTKAGFSSDELKQLLDSYDQYQNIKICGLMVIGNHTDDQGLIKETFIQANDQFNQLKNHFPSFDILSMGMSNDYQIALNCGSTHVRIGSLLFK